MNRKPATPLRIAGEVQMKKIQHDMTVLRRTNERLLSNRAKLVEALRDLIACDDNAPHDDHAGKFGAALDPARALLRSLGEL